MKTRFAKLSILFLLVLLPGSLSLRAQSNTTALSGVVTDATGAVISGVEVTLANAATGTTQMTQSKSKGEFSFEQLAPGTYEVKVVSPGFSEQDQKIELLVATPVKLAFKLVAGSSEVVNVETNLAAVNTTDATLGKAFNSAQVQNLPYLANNVTYLLSLQPGVLSVDSGAPDGRAEYRHAHGNRERRAAGSEQPDARRRGQQRPDLRPMPLTARCARRATRWRSSA